MYGPGVRTDVGTTLSVWHASHCSQLHALAADVAPQADTEATQSSQGDLHMFSTLPFRLPPPLTQKSEAAGSTHVFRT